MKEIKDLNIKAFKKIDSLDEKSLKEEKKAAYKKLYILSMKRSLGELKQTHLMKPLRKYIARINTLAKTKSINI